MSRNACGVDVANGIDPMVAEYLSENLSHMETMMHQTKADPRMMDLQPELEWHMRPVLVDFLVHAHYNMRLSPETLLLAVSLTDRYGSKRVIYRRHYQLVGCTALWIASKFCDKKQQVPTLQELVVLCSSTYEPAMFTLMEAHILNTLDWSIGSPTADYYVNQMLCQCKLHPRTRALLEQIALYLVELCLFQRELMVYTPADVGCAAAKLALTILAATTSFCCSSNEVPASTREAHCMNLVLQAVHAPAPRVHAKYQADEALGAAQYVLQFVDDSLTASTAVCKMPSTPKGESGDGAEGYMTPPFTPQS